MALTFIQGDLDRRTRLTEEAPLLLHMGLQLAQKSSTEACQAVVTNDCMPARCACYPPCLQVLAA